MTAAFEGALTRLGLVDRSDPLTTAVAKAIIQLAKEGANAAGSSSLEPLNWHVCAADPKHSC